MPAPDHLIPLLTALGDGGTVATAERIASAAGTGQPVTVDLVMDAIGTGATRDVAERVAALYGTAVEDALAGPVVNETTEPVTPELAEAIAASDPDAPEAAASGGEDSDEDEWEASGLDEFAAPTEPKPEEATPAPEPEAAPEPASAATVRAWAKASGVKVPARGAIPTDVRDAYNTAHA